MADRVYHFKHGWIPLDHVAAAGHSNKAKSAIRAAHTDARDGASVRSNTNERTRAMKHLNSAEEARAAGDFHKMTEHLDQAAKHLDRGGSRHGDKISAVANETRKTFPEAPAEAAPSAPSAPSDDTLRAHSQRGTAGEFQPPLKDAFGSRYGATRAQHNTTHAAHTGDVAALQKAGIDVQPGDRLHVSDGTVDSATEPVIKVERPGASHVQSYGVNGMGKARASGLTETGYFHRNGQVEPTTTIPGGPEAPAAGPRSAAADAASQQAINDGARAEAAVRRNEPAEVSSQAHHAAASSHALARDAHLQAAGEAAARGDSATSADHASAASNHEVQRRQHSEHGFSLAQRPGKGTPTATSRDNPAHYTPPGSLPYTHPTDAPAAESVSPAQAQSAAAVESLKNEHGYTESKRGGTRVLESPDGNTRVHVQPTGTLDRKVKQPDGQFKTRGGWMSGANDNAHPSDIAARINSGDVSDPRSWDSPAPVLDDAEGGYDDARVAEHRRMQVTDPGTPEREVTPGVSVPATPPTVGPALDENEQSSALDAVNQDLEAEMEDGDPEMADDMQNQADALRNGGPFSAQVVNGIYSSVVDQASYARDDGDDGLAQHYDDIAAKIEAGALGGVKPTVDAIGRPLQASAGLRADGAFLSTLAMSTTELAGLGLDDSLLAVTAKERKQAADKGQALDDGSYPIRNRSDLTKAVRIFPKGEGNGGKTKESIKRHIVKRARAMKAESRLPESWGVTAAGASVVNADDPNTPLTDDEIFAFVAAALVEAPPAEVPEEVGGGVRFRIPLLVPTDIETGDRREFKSGGLTSRDFPMPLYYQTMTDDGHKNSVIVARIDKAEKVKNGIGNAEGEFDTGDHAQEALRLIRNLMLRGVSADMDKTDAEATMSEQDGKPKVLFDAARLTAGTLVGKPAFAECQIELPGDEEWERNMTKFKDQYGDDIKPLVAAGGPITPPKSWFDNPGLTEPTHLTVLDDGRVFGHIAAWGIDHIGMPFQQAPRSKSGYRYFATGQVKCDDGSLVDVGQLTLAGGHADTSLSAQMAIQHYDDTNSAVADVAIGEDQFGIWVAGAQRPDLSESQVRQFRASDSSGDWRPINGNLELVACCQVNCAGFPIPRARVVDQQVLALTAAGAVMVSRKGNEAALEALNASALNDRLSRLEATENQRQAAVAAELSATLASGREALLASTKASLIASAHRMPTLRGGESDPKARSGREAALAPTDRGEGGALQAGGLTPGQTVVSNGAMTAAGVPHVYHFRHGWIPIDGVKISAPIKTGSGPGGRTESKVTLHGEEIGIIEKKGDNTSPTRTHDGQIVQSMGSGPGYRARLGGRLGRSTDSTHRKREDAVADLVAQHREAAGLPGGSKDKSVTNADLTKPADVAESQQESTPSAPAQTVHLQGYGKHPAKPVSELQPGDKVVYNYGETATVVKSEPSGRGKHGLTVRSDSSGTEHTSTKQSGTLVGWRAGDDATQYPKPASQQMKEHHESQMRAPQPGGGVHYSAAEKRAKQQESAAASEAEDRKRAAMPVEDYLDYMRQPEQGVIWSPGEDKQNEDWFRAKHAELRQKYGEPGRSDIGQDNQPTGTTEVLDRSAGHEADQATAIQSHPKFGDVQSAVAHGNDEAARARAEDVASDTGASRAEVLRHAQAASDTGVVYNPAATRGVSGTTTYGKESDGTPITAPVHDVEPGETWENNGNTYRVISVHHQTNGDRKGGVYYTKLRDGKPFGPSLSTNPERARSLIGPKGGQSTAPVTPDVPATPVDPIQGIRDRQIANFPKLGPTQIKITARDNSDPIVRQAAMDELDRRGVEFPASWRAAGATPGQSAGGPDPYEGIGTPEHQFSPNLEDYEDAPGTAKVGDFIRTKNGGAGVHRVTEKTEALGATHNWVGTESSRGLPNTFKTNEIQRVRPKSAQPSGAGLPSPISPAASSPSMSAKQRRAFQAASEGDHKWLQEHGFTTAHWKGTIHADPTNSKLAFTDDIGDHVVYGVTGNGQAQTRKTTGTYKHMHGTTIANAVAKGELPESFQKVHEPTGDGVSVPDAPPSPASAESPHDVEWSNADQPWSKIHPDFKSTDANGRRTVLGRTRDGGTVSVPWTGPQSGGVPQPISTGASSPMLSNKARRAFRAASEGDHAWLTAHGFTRHDGSPLQGDETIHADPETGVIGIEHDNLTRGHRVSGNGQSVGQANMGPNTQKVHEPTGGVSAPAAPERSLLPQPISTGATSPAMSSKARRAFQAASEGDHAWLRAHGFSGADAGGAIHASPSGETMGPSLAFAQPDGTHTIHGVTGNGQAKGAFQHRAEAPLPADYQKVHEPRGDGVPTAMPQPGENDAMKNRILANRTAAVDGPLQTVEPRLNSSTGIVSVTHPDTGKEIHLGKVYKSRRGNPSARGGAYLDTWKAEQHPVNGTRYPIPMSQTYDTRREAQDALLQQRGVQRRLAPYGLTLGQSDDGNMPNVDMGRDGNQMAAIGRMTPEQRQRMGESKAASDARRLDAARQSHPVGTKVSFAPYGDTGTVEDHTPNGDLRVKTDKSGKTIVMGPNSVTKVDAPGLSPGEPVPSARIPIGQTGQRVENEYGKGTVTDSTDRSVSIKLDSGETINVQRGTPGFGRIKPADGGGGAPASSGQSFRDFMNPPTAESKMSDADLASEIAQLRGSTKSKDRARLSDLILERENRNARRGADPKA